MFGRQSLRRLHHVAFNPAVIQQRHAARRPQPPMRPLSEATRPPSALSDFNELRERALLRHVISTSTEGDPESVLNAMDVFWHTYFHGQGTAEWKLRGEALDSAITKTALEKKGAPMLSMELGTYCGYTAVRMGRRLPPGAKLVSVEIEPLFAAIASKVVEHAGLSDTVKVEIGSVMTRLPSIQKKFGKRPLDALLLDHAVTDFLPDLKFLELNGMITAQTTVLCDWNLYPGTDATDLAQAPQAGKEFMEYLKQIGDKDMRTTKHTLGDKDVFTVSTWTGVI